MVDAASVEVPSQSIRPALKSKLIYKLLEASRDHKFEDIGTDRISIEETEEMTALKEIFSENKPITFYKVLLSSSLLLFFINYNNIRLFF
jgi:hypothetical protein